MSKTLSSIERLMDTMRKSEKKVADCVLKNPEAVITATITDFSEITGTSEPTVIRFCRKVGLSGYMELKLNLARELPASTAVVEDIGLNDDFSDIFDKIFNSTSEAINVTREKVDKKVLQKSVNALLAAERVLFFGLGGSGTVALDAQQKFVRLGIHCYAYIDSHMQAITASQLSPRDVVIAVSHSGSSKDLLENVKIARKTGAKVIGLIGRERTPLSKESDLPLSVYSKEVAVKLMPLASRFGMLVLLDILFIAVALGGEGNMERLNLGKLSLKNKKY